MASRNLRILLVEDSDDDAILVRRAFGALGLGHQLVICPDGETALSKVRTERPDLVLMDINLPRINGIEVLRRLKSDQRLRSIPVIMLSASDRERDVHGAYEAGANHYLVKPLAFDDFCQLLQTWSQYWGTVGRLPRAE